MDGLLSASLLAILPTRCHAPHGFQAAIAYGVYVVIKVRTGANVIGGQPECVTEAQRSIDSTFQMQATMLSTQGSDRGARQVGRYRQTQVNAHCLLASIGNSCARFWTARHRCHDARCRGELWPV